jgi:hypothetical protein
MVPWSIVTAADHPLLDPHLGLGDLSGHRSALLQRSAPLHDPRQVMAGDVRVLPPGQDLVQRAVVAVPAGVFHRVGRDDAEHPDRADRESVLADGVDLAGCLM